MNLRYTILRFISKTSNDKKRDDSNTKDDGKRMIIPSSDVIDIDYDHTSNPNGMKTRNDEEGDKLSEKVN